MLGDRPLVIYDLETTGLDKSKDQIIQIALVKYDWNIKKIIDSKNYYIQPEGNYSIPIGAYMVHHINAEFLKDKPHFREVASEIFDFFTGCDIVTYNGCSFDNAILTEEFSRCGILFDVRSCDNYDCFYEEKRINGNRLSDTFKRYYGKTMDECGLNAHDALSDVKATAAIFVKQQEAHPYEPEEILTIDNVVAMQEFNGKVVPCFTLGKYRGLGVEFVAGFDQGYIAWAIGDTSKFVPSTKEYLKKFLKV